ncbi:hypothetical protein M422DRAFT_778215 [Sphaerobolus stellatus SS14]|nr:hypothetical protein M422DRAFT_778215 [Sphaerobolus stellatus SS14]
MSSAKPNGFPGLVVSSIVALRTYALFGRRRVLLYFLSATLILQATIMVVLHIQTVIKKSAGGRCTFRGPGGTAVNITIFFWYPLVMDTVVFVATIYRIRRLRAEAGQTCSIIQAIMKDGTLYYVATCIINLVNIVIFQKLPNQLNMIGFITGFALTTSFTCHFFLHLQGLRPDDDQTKQDDSANTLSGLYTTALITTSVASPFVSSVPRTFRSSYFSRTGGRDTVAIEMEVLGNDNINETAAW